MRKKGFAIAVLIAAVAVVTAVVVVSRNRGAHENAVEAVAASESQEEAIVSAEDEKAVQGAEDGNNREAGPAPGVSDAKLQVGSTGKQEPETVLGLDAAGRQPGTGVIVPPTAGMTEADATVVNDGEVFKEDDEINRIELPVETDIPEGWDWKSYPGTDDSHGGGNSSGKDSSGESGESESSTTGEPEGQSAEEDSTQESGSDEGSTEETETETTTLSPEEQASIVESATAPIELPPIFIN